MFDKKEIQKKGKDLLGASVEPTIEVVSKLAFDGLAGTVLPGVMNAVLAYKIRRQKRNLDKFIEEMFLRGKEIEARLNKLDKKREKEFRDKYFGMVSDYVIDEVQEEKIKYLVNGYIQIGSLETVQDDLILTFYDTLKSLRIIDIAVLKLYAPFSKASFKDILDEFDIEWEQYEAVRSKLARMKLIEEKREKDIYEAVEEIRNQLELLNKKGTLDVRKVKKISRKDSYSITRFGRNFINFFSV